jgi:hypothetical protein
MKLTNDGLGRVRRLVTLAKAADLVTIQGRRAIRLAAEDVERVLFPVKRLARLNRDEARTYSDAFELYLNNVRRDSGRADRYAWRQCVASYPRLAAFEGAKP